MRACYAVEAESEYLELQRRYKNIENDRKAYNEETQAQLKKQKNLLDKLQKENSQLKEELIAQGNQMNRAKSSSSVQQPAAASAEEIQEIKEQIEQEREKQLKAEADIKTLQKEIVDQKRKQKGVNGTQERYS